jgi:iron(III) transport system ATP-binding protein
MAHVGLEGLTKSFARSGVVVDSIDLAIEEGEFFTLLGPSGCGKSTTLRMIAGFEEPTAGRIWFRDRDVTWLAPNQRDVGLVFQNYALFPHLSVGKNIAFGLAAHKVKRSEIAPRVAAALELVQLGGYDKARVDELSGGQQQRVALARAIVIRPQLLLLDEPLSNLDAKLRDETRSALRRIHQETGLTSVYVTHDQAEALAMSTRVAVMSKARVDQVGTPTEVYERPATRFVAGFIGRNNVYDATVTAREDDQVTIDIAGMSFQASASHGAPGVDLRVGGPAVVAIRAEQVRLGADTTGDNDLAARVADCEYVGAMVYCTLDTAIGDVKCDLGGHVRVPPRGERLDVHLPGPAWYFLPAGVGRD